MFFCVIELLLLLENSEENTGHSQKIIIDLGKCLLKSRKFLNIPKISRYL